MGIKSTALGGTLMTLALVAGLMSPAYAQTTDVDFGDDSSEWAKDGECDDPRFTGTGMADELEDADILKDATDCRTAFEAGDLTLAAETTAPATETEEAAGATAAPEIDFGDDTSSWANDGECDDARFAGEGMALELEDADTAHDATDCRTLFDSGKIALAPADVEAVPAVSVLEFGDDSSEWAKDEECDDPRFAGTGMAASLDDVNIGKDATDCEAAFNAGTIALSDTQPGDPVESPSSTAMLTALATRIDFGDDSGDFPNDGECDDPDFVGSAMAPEPMEGDRLGDATDCRAAFIAGTVSLKGAGAMPIAFDYGSDISRWANDAECDDWRFAGSTMSKKLYAEDVLGDATDCQTLEQNGSITIKPVYQPGYALNGPYDGSSIDFGDDSSSYAKDNVCDDPRFEGPGTASMLYDSDINADATDCLAAFEAGTVALKDGQA